VEEDPSKSVAVVVVFVCTWDAAIILRTNQSRRALEDTTECIHFEHANGSSKLPGTL